MNRETIQKESGGKMGLAVKKAHALFEMHKFSDPNQRRFMNQYRAVRDRINSETAVPKEETDLADVLEGMFVDPLIAQQIVGPGVITKKTDDYDNVRNGVDIVWQFPQSHTESRKYPLRLAIDMTYAASEEVIVDKLAKIREGIFSIQRMALIADGDVNVEVRDYPRIILGVEVYKIKRLMDFWIANDYKGISLDSSKAIILAEIHSQLKRMYDHAGQLLDSHASNKLVANRLNSIRQDLKLINQHLKSIHGSIVKPHDTDRVYDQIEECLPFFSTLQRTK